MALFNGNKRIEGSRSNTALVKSGHMSPAEEWLLDPKFKDLTMTGIFKDGALFTYQYGGPGTDEVVIPKGRVVGVSKPVKDFTTKKYKTTITLPGISTGNNVVGMVPYNICKDYFQMDRFGGNPPSIITMDYVTLPYIPGIEPSASFDQTGLLDEEKRISVDTRMPWGAVIGAGIAEGDYLKATPSGRLTKWNRGTDNAIDVVGQILASDFNQEAWGWYKWMMWDETARSEDDVFMNRSGASNLPSDGGYPYDSNYVQGNTIFEQYQSEFVSNPTGIPGIHDGSGNFTGYGRNDTDYKDMPLGTVPTGVADNTLQVFQVLDYAGGKVVNLQEGVQVSIDGTGVDASRLTINYQMGTITVKLLSTDADKPVTVTYRAYHYGTPSYLDFKGVVGSFAILLKK